MTWTRLVCVLAASLVLAGAAQAATVAVIVVPPFDPETYATRGAVGLMPPGDGATVSRKGALASLLQGRTEKALLGGVPNATPLIELSDKPGDVTIYASLPPTGTHPNDTRFPVAIVGGGYRGILESPSTRIPGLVSIADIAPTAVALAAGDEPRIGWTQGTPADLRALDTRLTDQDAARNSAVAILALAALAFGLAALATGSSLLGRAGLLAAPIALASAIVLSAVGVGEPAWLLPLLAVLTTGAALAGAAALPRRRALALFLAALIGAYLVVLVLRPTWPALAAIGPNPGEGGRFYGSTNLTTSVVLTCCLFAGAALGRRDIIAVSALSMVTVGWSKAGADGGGVVVLVAACLALGISLVSGKLTARGLALSAGLAVAVGLALVGLDAATGGSSHVTRKVEGGPGALLSELVARMHISLERVTSSWHAALVSAIAVACLLALALRRPRFTGADALLVGIAVSLVVNDTPQHVVAAGAISYGVWWAYERASGRASLSKLRPGQ